MAGKKKTRMAAFRQKACKKSKPKKVSKSSLVSPATNEVSVKISQIQENMADNSEKSRRAMSQAIHECYHNMRRLQTRNTTFTYVEKAHAPYEDVLFNKRRVCGDCRRAPLSGSGDTCVISKELESHEFAGPDAELGSMEATSTASTNLPAQDTDRMDVEDSDSKVVPMEVAPNETTHDEYSQSNGDGCIKKDEFDFQSFPTSTDTTNHLVLPDVGFSEMDTDIPMDCQVTYENSVGELLVPPDDSPACTLDMQPLEGSTTDEFQVLDDCSITRMSDCPDNTSLLPTKTSEMLDMELPKDFQDLNDDSTSHFVDNNGDMSSVSITNLPTDTQVPLEGDLCTTELSAHCEVPYEGLCPQFLVTLEDSSTRQSELNSDNLPTTEDIQVPYKNNEQGPVTESFTDFQASNGEPAADSKGLPVLTVDQNPRIPSGPIQKPVKRKFGQTDDTLTKADLKRGFYKMKNGRKVFVVPVYRRQFRWAKQVEAGVSCLRVLYRGVEGYLRRR